MADNRISRTQETREAEVVHEAYLDNWEPAAMLSTKDIPARPGFVQRWVRTALKGVDDQSNVFSKIAQRWSPRPASSVPKGSFVPSVKFQDADIIGFQGMILMERPEELHQRHAAFNLKQANNLVSAEESNLYKVHDSSNKRYVTRPEFTHSSETTTGRVPDIDD
jgi:hypothetical protein